MRSYHIIFQDSQFRMYLIVFCIYTLFIILLLTKHIRSKKVRIRQWHLSNILVISVQKYFFLFFVQEQNKDTDVN